jgi:hypothetical protein
MSESSRQTSRPWEPQRYRQEAHRPEPKLPEGDGVFFLLDTVSKLDVSRFSALYEEETRGAPPFDPAMLVCLLLYAYCVGGGRAVRSRRRASGTWRAWPLWGRSARPVVPSAIVASCLWTPVAMCVSTCGVWQARQGG